MTNLILLFVVLFFSASVSASSAGPKFYPGENGCLNFADLATGVEALSYGENCEVRTPPCSTFKVALAEVGFASGKLNPNGEEFKWDGVKRGRDALNRDQDLRSWMKDSVVWVSSVIVDRVGRERVRSQLSELGYGNALVGPGEFWIDGPLKISVLEQVTYLSRQSSDSFKKALHLLPTERLGGFEVSGKTGSCYVGSRAQGSQIGWFVGRASSSGKEYAFALRFIDEENRQTTGPAGFRARELFIEWLQRRKVDE